MNIKTKFDDYCLIDTGDGLIVIDPGYPQSLYLVIDNIYRLGFQIKDIKYMDSLYPSMVREDSDDIAYGDLPF